MPADQCADCEAHFPGGEGLQDGRCPACAAEFTKRHKKDKKSPPAETPEEEE